MEADNSKEPAKCGCGHFTWWLDLFTGQAPALCQACVDELYTCPHGLKLSQFCHVCDPEKQFDLLESLDDS